MNQPWIDGAVKPPDCEAVWYVSKAHPNLSPDHFVLDETNEEDWGNSFWLPAPTPPAFVAPEPPLPEVKRCSDHPEAGVISSRHIGYPYWECRCNLGECGTVARSTTQRLAIIGWNAMQGET